MSEGNVPAAATPLPEHPEIVGGTDPVPAVESVPESNVVLENASVESAPAETPAAEPVTEAIEPAPAEEQPNSSPSPGSESPAPVIETGAAPAPKEQPPEEPKESPTNPPEDPPEEKPSEKPTAEPAPTLQPPLPGVGVFEEHGRPAQGTQPKVKTGVYVDADGVKHTVEIVAERKDGRVDIMLPAVIGGYRRDAIGRRESDEQKGDYIE